MWTRMRVSAASDRALHGIPRYLNHSSFRVARAGNAINLPALVAGTIALGINEGAYMTEIVRAALISVDPG
jgi:ABC-type amino acid transport system permease subunit